MNFDRLAPFYHSLERVAAGRLLQECRTEFLTQIPPPRHILLAGEGHGRFLPTCADRFPHAHITVVDGSRNMLEIARRRCSHPNVRFIHAEIPQWTEQDTRFDLIVTHFFLDCFPPETLPAAIASLAEMAAPEANWMIADFEIPPRSRKFRHWRARTIVALLYGFFRAATQLPARSLVPPDPFLEAAGFSLHHRRTRDWGLLKTEWWQRKAPSPSPCGTSSPGL